MDNIYTFKIPLEKIKRARYFKREAKHLISKAALLTQNQRSENENIRKCMCDLDGDARAFLIGPAKPSDILSALHLPLDTGEKTELKDLNVRPCLDVLLFCFEEEFTEKAATELRTTILNFKRLNVFETIIFVNTGPSKQIQVESGTHILSEAKYNLFEWLQKIFNDLGILDKESVKSFIHKDQLTKEIDTRLEMTILQRLKQTQDTVSDTDVKLKIVMAQMDDIPKKISSILDILDTLLYGWSLEWEENGQIKENDQGTSETPWMVSGLSPPKDLPDFSLRRLTYALTQCICDSFVSDLKALTETSWSSLFKNVQYESVYKEVFKSVLKNMPNLFETGKRKTISDRGHFLGTKIKHKKILEAVMKSYRDCLQSKRQKYIGFALHRLNCQIGSLFHESKIERFKTLSQNPVTKISDSVAEKLFSVSSVIGFGYSFGTLLIDVEERDYSENDNEELYNKLKKILHKCDVKNFTIRANSLKYDLLYRAGAGIRKNNDRKGTLGGFAEMHNLASPETFSLCGLVSRHVIQGPPGSNKADLVYGIGERSPIGNVNCRDSDGFLDISSFQVNSGLPVITKFRNSFGEETTCKLYTFPDEELADLIGKRVYIRGGATELGKGEIILNNFQRVDDPLHKLVLVKDANKDEAFCKEGDSGSIVLTDHPDGYVVVLAMLIGRNDKEEYLTFRLTDGLQNLETRISGGVFFKLCDEED